MKKHQLENAVESASTLKPGAQMCQIREQILRDPLSGLTFQFELEADGLIKFRIYGDDLPYGNREIIFDQDGHEAGAGTAVRGLCRPGWLIDASDL
jgi:hypothetical protein